MVQRSAAAARGRVEKRNDPLGWPKPKLKLEFKKGYDTEDGGGGDGGKKLVLRPPFEIEGEGPGAAGQAAPMTSVDLDSLWWEPGSNSYVRQAAAFAALRSVARVRGREKGVSLSSFFLILRFLKHGGKKEKTHALSLSLDPFSFLQKQKTKKAPALLTRHVVVRRDGSFYGSTR